MVVDCASSNADGPSFVLYISTNRQQNSTYYLMDLERHVQCGNKWHTPQPNTILRPHLCTYYPSWKMRRACGSTSPSPPPARNPKGRHSNSRNLCYPRLMNAAQGSQHPLGRHGGDLFDGERL